MIETLERMLQILKGINRNLSEQSVPEEIFESELKTLRTEILGLYEDIDNIINYIDANAEISQTEICGLLKLLYSKYEELLNRVMITHDILIEMLLKAEN
ncbi:hypothetical protein [Methanosarcina acetivorans]|uniref:Uncharacterized protein n=1 Tax=Methanosarcina acetivorans (strain ATCC 35395 / DSM 2834 / JCM 12185 / C2A) TaxID=188937 RepID=Q8TP78_METAC|nr:hypothetical protein [Methanosarcina acetivorans]AAM05441.1 predicted protein [Methanosarcina acetivorans C2A]